MRTVIRQEINGDSAIFIPKCSLIKDENNKLILYNNFDQVTLKFVKASE